MACAIEDAGFEIRDCVQWWYATGFPKSTNVSKAIDAHLGAERTVVGERTVSRVMAGSGDMVGGTVRAGAIPITAAATAAAGLGTALKPAVEPAVVARKPLGGTVAACVLAHGTGALNIDGCRIGWASDADKAAAAAAAAAAHRAGQDVGETAFSGRDPATFAAYVDSSASGRWPANLIMDEHVAEMLDATHGDTGGASRFFFVPKPDGTERDAGLDDMPTVTRAEATDREEGSAGSKHARAGAGASGRRNTHPTVKPIDLMRYLCRLVTPRGGVVLDLFVGSGTTGIAAALEGFGFIGIDMEEKHIEIAKRRIAWWTARCVAEETAARAALSTRGEQDERQRSIFEVLK
jgi:site-specific DNA-methyltransferase (adenine-specific)